MTERAQLPDGRILEFPDGTPMSVIQGKVRELLGVVKDQTSASQVFGREAVGGYIDNIRKLPATALNAAAGSILGAGMPFMPDNQRDAAKAVMGAYIGNQPSLNTPIPSTNDIFAGTQTATEMGAMLQRGRMGQPIVYPTSFQNARTQQQALTDTGAQEHPVAGVAGDITGDVAALSVLRSPIAGQRGREQLAARVVSDAAKTAPYSGPNLATSSTVMEWMKNIGLTANKSALANSAGRVVEAGVEGAALALLKENDPVQAAQYAAGTQLGGNMILSGWNGIFSGSKMGVAGKLALATGGLWAGLQILSGLTPGGDNSPIDNVKTAAGKIGWGLVAGLITGLSGQGRITGGLPVAAIPAAADYLTSIPRVAFQSALQDIVSDPNSSAVFKVLQENPNAFSPRATRLMERALTNPGISFKDTVADLWNSREFRLKFKEE